MVSEEELFAEEREKARRKKEKEEAEEKARRDRFFIREEIQKKQEKEMKTSFAEGVKEGEQIGGLFADAVYSMKLDAEYARTEALFAEEPGMLSGRDMLKELAETEKEDSPFRKLSDLLQDSPKPNAKTEKAVNEFVDEAEETVLEDVKVELARQLAKQKTEGEKPSMDAARRIFEHRLGLRMNVLSKAMDEQRFEKLCDSIQKQGLAINKDQYKGLSIAEYRKQKTELGLDAMKEISSGQTPAFRKMMNSTEAYVNAKDPGHEKEARQQLSQDIAEYVMKDCAPGKQDPDPTALNTAMYTLKSILPEKAFDQFVDQFNAQPGRGVHYKPEQFNKLPEAAAPKAERGLDAPVRTLEKPKPWEE